MAESQNFTLSIDGKNYEYEQLSEKARNAINSLRATDAEISRLQTQLGIAQTARAAYSQLLQSELQEATAPAASAPQKSTTAPKKSTTARKKPSTTSTRRKASSSTARKTSKDSD